MLGIRKVLIDHVVPAFNLMDILAFDYPFHISGAYLRGRNDLRNCFGCQVSCSQLQVASPCMDVFFIFSLFGISSLLSTQGGGSGANWKGALALPSEQRKTVSIKL